MRKTISTEKAPAAIGPYSQGVSVGRFIFVSGQLPMDPGTMKIVEGGIEVQTKQALENLKAVLDEAGTCINNVVKTTLFIKDMEEFSTINKIYATYFRDNKPARACVEVARLPMDVKIEIEAIAII